MYRTFINSFYFQEKNLYINRLLETIRKKKFTYLDHYKKKTNTRNDFCSTLPYTFPPISYAIAICYRYLHVFFLNHTL